MAPKLFSILLFFTALELMIRIFHVDVRLTAPILFYAKTDSEIHRASQDANLLYELIPGSRFSYKFGYHAKENEITYPRHVNINELGYRNSPWPKEKQPGKFRIAVFGGSNAYGISVDDEHTWPYLLFQALEKKYPGRFEVWNGGVVASVLSYKMRRAEIAVNEINPDLIIVKHFFNIGRRHFYSKQTDDLSAKIQMLIDHDYFSKNPELWEENIPLFLKNQLRFLSSHRFLVRNVAIYRVIMTLIDRRIFESHSLQKRQNDCVGNADCGYIIAEMNYVARDIGEKKVDEFREKFPNQPVIFFDPVKNIYCNKNEKSEFRGYPVFSLCTESMADEYRNIHPPVYVYRYYVEKILDYLEKNNFIPQKPL